MKREVRILIATLVCISTFQAKAQNSTSSLDSFRNVHLANAGLELQRFHKGYTMGVTMTIAGGAILGIGVAMADDSSGPAIAGLGGLFMLVGTMVTISSHKHVRIAGTELHYAGTGVTIPIRSKKKRS